MVKNVFMLMCWQEVKCHVKIKFTGNAPHHYPGHGHGGHAGIVGHGHGVYGHGGFVG